LLADLAEQLTALSDALESGAPVDPALERKIVETVDALAVALGITLPPPPTIDPAITVAATTDETIALDPLKAIDPASDAPVPVSPDLPATPGDMPVADAPQGATLEPALGSIVPAAPVSTPTISTDPTSIVAAAAPAVPDVSAPTAVALPTETAQSTIDADAPEAATPATARVDTAEKPVDAPNLPPVIKQLAEKITEIAAVLAPRLPVLAQKLEAFAANLTSPELAEQIIAKLSASPATMPEAEIADAIERLLAPQPDSKPATPQPSRFASASLALPDVLTAIAPKEPTSEAPARIAPTPVPPPAANADAPPSKPVEQPSVQVATVEEIEPAPIKAEPTAPGRAVAAAAGNNHNQPAPPANDAAQPPPNAAPPNALPATASPVAVEARAIHAAYKAPVHQINIPQVAFEVVRQVQAGNSRFQIRLDPPELGRIDVKLDVDKSGNVSAKMTVERVETLDLMQRDRTALERALAQAGLDSNKTNLEFSLRQNPFAREEQNFAGNRQDGGGNFPAFGTAETEDPAPQVAAYRGTASPGGVNLFV
jgi:flagellar hook-length control protein FliK